MKKTLKNVKTFFYIYDISKFGSELRRSTSLVYHSNRQALSTARFRRRGQFSDS